MARAITKSRLKGSVVVPSGPDGWAARSMPLGFGMIDVKGKGEIKIFSVEGLR